MKFLKLARVVHWVASFGRLFQMEIVVGKNESWYNRVLSCGWWIAGLSEERVLYVNTWWCTGASANSVRLCMILNRWHKLACVRLAFREGSSVFDIIACPTAWCTSAMQTSAHFPVYQFLLLGQGSTQLKHTLNAGRWSCSKFDQSGARGLVELPIQ